MVAFVTHSTCLTEDVTILTHDELITSTAIELSLYPHLGDGPDYYVRIRYKHATLGSASCLMPCEDLDDATQRQKWIWDFLAKHRVSSTQAAVTEMVKKVAEEHCVGDVTVKRLQGYP